MDKYIINKPKTDFISLTSVFNIKGSRQKKLVIDNDEKLAMFKYERSNYICSEACSEKLSYEIACVLGYKCAVIELAEDENGESGVLNYLFTDILSKNNQREHTDIIAYININNEARPMYYTISNIKKTLDNLNPTLFEGFIRIMIFDALIGEQDRHEENWGITRHDGKYEMSPLYDNGCSLLREFKDEKYAEKFYNGIKDFNSYILKSQSIIYHDDHIRKYKHFELIEYLNGISHDIVQRELEKLNELTDEAIESIVNKIPDELLTIQHKNYIIMYLEKRRDILLSIK